MSLLNSLERRFGHLAVPRIALYLIIGQVFVFFATQLQMLPWSNFLLVPGLVLQGEVWRIFAFVFLPPASPWYFIAFAWYIFFMTSNAVEEQIGVFRFNLFLLVGWALTVGCGFIVPNSLITNTFLAGSVFLAFALLHPNFEFLIFFILPVKVKWLAWISVGLSIYTMIVGDWGTRLSILASMGNFLLFFGRDLAQWGQLRQRQVVMSGRRRELQRQLDEPQHRCVTCGKDSNAHPDLDFRYCSQCDGAACYCPDHIKNHEHIRAAAE